MTSSIADPSRSVGDRCDGGRRVKLQQVVTTLETGAVSSKQCRRIIKRHRPVSVLYSRPCTRRGGTSIHTTSPSLQPIPPFRGEALAAANQTTRRQGNANAASDWSVSHLRGLVIGAANRGETLIDVRCH